MFTIEMLPAAHGDGLLIEYGSAGQRNRVLIDGGTEPAYKGLKARIERMKPSDRRFELLVVTHVDADHIGGILKMLQKNELGVEFDQIWFNGFPHLDVAATPPKSKVEYFGAVQAEKLSSLLLDLGIPWNTSFGGRTVCVPERGDLPIVTLTGGLKLTILGPTRQKLLELKPVWEKACAEAGLDPLTKLPPEPMGPDVEAMGPIDVDALAATSFKEDNTKPNGSSIALLAEFHGKRVLLGADSHPTTLETAIDRLAGPNKRLQLDAFKLPHHGSKKNVSVELLNRVHCERYLVSTNGKQFGHPDREAIARVIKHGGAAPKLHFNFRTEHNSIWDAKRLKEEHGYETVYPTGQDGLLVSI